jgi:DNA processing protein
MHTVEEAQRRDRAVLAVPGPVTSPVSRGTNRLLAEGATPVCDAGDVLVAIGAGGRRAPARVAADLPCGEAGAVLDAMGWQPATLDHLVLRTGLPLGTVARLTLQLEGGGWIAADGGWFERRR